MGTISQCIKISNLYDIHLKLIGHQLYFNLKKNHNEAKHQENLEDKGEREEPVHFQRERERERNNMQKVRNWNGRVALSIKRQWSNAFKILSSVFPIWNSMPSQTPNQE